MAWYRNYGKRMIDLAVSLVALLLLLPVIVLVGLVLWFANKGNPFFFQWRPGRNGKVFRLVKFRTMNNRRDEKGALLADGVRLTPIGRFVRKTSLDELPQLINVIKGDMSLVGPRPLLVEYLPLYNSTQARRHEVRPGITGWAQVNGRNAISWEQKFDYDVYYVDHLHWRFDVRVILLTIQKVFKTEGISQQGHATMPAFKGAQQV
ncbi:sugar transferase [Paraflavitalea pollutisoli]|uniref:sugar transferase n=1 Tax=Paraflavitalea pollutisoli TaxID=3034143 RepID=UPI0023EB1DF0|nr:sugar transferase [Paraflavitalea sp. H1-2-19X]